MKFVSWAVLRFRYGLRVVGQQFVPAQGPFIVASNHVSFLDPLVVGVSCPRRLDFMARESLYRRSLLGWFLRGVGAIPLRRDEQDIGAIRTAIHRLRAGHPVALFPEGTRQRSGRLAAAKRGVGLIAVTARVPIVPVLVQGTFDALPPDATRLYPSKIRVAFGPPIPYTDFPPRAEETTAATAGTPVGGPPHSPASPVGSRAHQERLAATVTRRWHDLETQARTR